MSKVPESIDKIISLVPSLTELLYDLGLGSKIVGVTKFCVHPSFARNDCPVIGGTKNPHISRILELQPQLIIASKEENNQKDIEALANTIPVWVSDITSLEEATLTISQLGRILDCERLAGELIREIDQGFDGLPAYNARKAVYLIWQKPYMAAGTDTFISDIMSKAGFRNSIDVNRYPQLKVETIRELDPDVVFLSSEPYPFKINHQQELQSQLPRAKVMLVDGEMFSWYGSRLRHAPGYFKQLHQSEFPA